jgi:hypothetical protein
MWHARTHAHTLSDIEVTKYRILNDQPIFPYGHFTQENVYISACRFLRNVPSSNRIHIIHICNYNLSTYLRVAVAQSV